MTLGQNVPKLDALHLTPSPPSASSRRGWPWPGAGKVHNFAANLLLNFTAEWGILCLKGADRYAEH